MPKPRLPFEFARLADHTIRYRRYEPAGETKTGAATSQQQQQQQQPLVVFLHSALGCIDELETGGFPQMLCDRLRLPGLAYDRRGHGGSSAEAESMRETYPYTDLVQNELRALLDTVLAPGQKVVLVGHSDGGTVALMFASFAPSKVAATIAIAAHVVTEQVAVAGIQVALKAWAAGKMRRGLVAMHGDKADAVFHRWAWYASPSNADTDLRGLIACPTGKALVMQGELDEYATVDQVKWICEAWKGPATPCVLKGEKHFPHLD
eukprot:gene6174-9452_t